jgi:conjugal transfer mating pair stabilization protein TraG
MADGVTIFVYGDTSLYANVFKAVAMFVKGETMNHIIKLIAAIAVIWVGLLNKIQGRISPLPQAQWIMYFSVVLVILKGPTTNVVISDVLNSGHKTEKVDSVPYVIAELFSISSHIGKALTQGMEVIFVNSDDELYTKTGHIWGAKSVLSLGNEVFVDPLLKRNIDELFNRCIIYDVAIGSLYNVNDIQTTSDIWGLVKSKTSRIRGMYYDDGRSSRFYTCRAAAALIDAYWGGKGEDSNNKTSREIDLGSEVINFLSRDSHKPSAMQNQLKSQLGEYSLLAEDIARKSNFLLRQQMMINQIRSAMTVDGEINTDNYPVAKAVQMQASSMQLFGEIAPDQLLYLRNVLECLLIAAFAILLPTWLMPGGAKRMSQYAFTALWLQTWPAFFVILHYFATQKAMTLLTSHEMTLAVSVRTFTQINSIHTISSYLMMAIPMLSAMLLKGAGPTFEYMANGLLNASQAASNQMGHELATGNISQGNISIDNQSMNNRHANKWQESMMFEAGSHQIMASNGATLKSTASGNFVAQAGVGNSISNFGMSLANSSSLSDTLSKQHSDHLSASQTHLDQSSESFNAGISNASNFAKSISQDSNLHKSASAALSTDQNQSYTKTVDAIQAYAQQHGVDTGTATQMVARVAVDGGGIVGNAVKLFAGLKGEVGLSGSKQSSDTDSFRESKDFISKYGDAETFAKGLRVMDEMGQRHSAGQSLNSSDTVTSNFDKSVSEYESYQESESRAMSYQDAYNAVQSESSDIRYNLDQEFLDHMANSTLAGGNEPMGYSQASRIIATQDEVAQSYAEDFMRKKAQSLADQYQGRTINKSAVNSYLDIKGRESVEDNSGLVHERNKQEVMAKREEIKGVPELAPLEDLSQVPETLQNANKHLEHEQDQHRVEVSHAQLETKGDIALEMAKADKDGFTIMRESMNNSVKKMPKNIDNLGPKNDD